MAASVLSGTRAHSCARGAGQRGGGVPGVSARTVGASVAGEGVAAQRPGEGKSSWGAGCSRDAAVQAGCLARACSRRAAAGVRLSSRVQLRHPAWPRWHVSASLCPSGHPPARKPEGKGSATATSPASHCLGCTGGRPMPVVPRALGGGNGGQSGSSSRAPGVCSCTAGCCMPQAINNGSKHAMQPSTRQLPALGLAASTASRGPVGPGGFSAAAVARDSAVAPLLLAASICGHQRSSSGRRMPSAVLAQPARADCSIGLRQLLPARPRTCCVCCTSSCASSACPACSASMSAVHPPAQHAAGCCCLPTSCAISGSSTRPPAQAGVQQLQHAAVAFQHFFCFKACTSSPGPKPAGCRQRRAPGLSCASAGAPAFSSAAMSSGSGSGQLQAISSAVLPPAGSWVAAATGRGGSRGRRDTGGHHLWVRGVKCGV